MVVLAAGLVGRDVAARAGKSRHTQTHTQADTGTCKHIQYRHIASQPAAPQPSAACVCRA